MTVPLVAVLAGGASTRMGRDKGMVALGGRSMAEWVVKAGSSVGEVLVVGRRGTLAGVPAVPDPGHTRGGPLAGLVAAFGQAGSRAVLLVAVDQPWVRPETLRRLADLGDATPIVPVAEGHRQTTCALYPPHLAAEAEAMLTAGGSLRRLLAAAGCTDIEPPAWREWGEDGRSWFSVDDDASAAEGIRRYGLPRS